MDFDDKNIHQEPDIVLSLNLKKEQQPGYHLVWKMRLMQRLSLITSHCAWAVPLAKVHALGTQQKPGRFKTRKVKFKKMGIISKERLNILLAGIISFQVFGWCDWANSYDLFFLGQKLQRFIVKLDKPAQM